MSRTIDMTTTPRPVNPTEPVPLNLPPGAEVVYATAGVGSGGGMGMGMGSGPEVVIWYDYDAEATYEGAEDQYMVVPTGYVLPDGYSHVATVLFGGPSNAVHLYKAKVDEPVVIEPETPVIVDETPETDPEVGEETEVPTPDVPEDTGTEPEADPAEEPTETTPEPTVPSQPPATTPAE